jgi:hypothetical protein
MKRAIVVVALAVMCVVSVGSSVFAQSGKPQIAVYMTGSGLPKENKNQMRTFMSSILSERNWFRNFERQAAFQKVVDKELEKQGDGSVDQVNQIIYEAGKQVAVPYVCVGDVTSSSFGTVLSVRILHVETMEQVAIGDDDNFDVDFTASQVKAALTKCFDKMRKKVLDLLQKK